MSELAVIDRVEQEAVEQRGAIQLLLDLEGEGLATEVALQLGVMSYERWESVGRFLGGLDRRARWYIGDWLNHGEALFGEEASQGIEATTSERYSEAERITGLSHGTLLNIRSICGKIAAPRRRKELGFSVHEPVAKLDPDEQVLWLQRAIDNAWTREQLRDAIQAEKNPPTEGEHDDDAPAPVALTVAERIEAAARVVWQQASNNSDGDWVVPSSAMAQLRAALGEE